MEEYYLEISHDFHERWTFLRLSLSLLLGKKREGNYTAKPIT
jgi:hypothetical protein